MILSGLLSFFGGTAFRMIWGEISSYLTAKQNQKYEIESIRLQGELAAAAHVRNMEAIKVQADLNIKVIHVQAETDLAKLDGEIFSKGVEMTGRSTGIHIVDLWNGIIRPLLATMCIALWTLHLSRHNWTLDDNGWALVGAALGLFVADRTLMKRGK